MTKKILGCLAGVVLPILLLAYGSAAQMKGDASTGKLVHEKHCQRCHGEQGKGDGPSTKKIKAMKMVDWTDKEAMSKLTDENLYKITSGGGAGVGKSKLMPAYKDKLSEKDVAAVVAFIRSLTQK